MCLLHGLGGMKPEFHRVSVALLFCFRVSLSFYNYYHYIIFIIAGQARGSLLVFTIPHDAMDDQIMTIVRYFYFYFYFYYLYFSFN